MKKIDSKITGFSVVGKNDTETVVKEDPVDSYIPLKRPDELVGSTYKIKPSAPYQNHALYITINDVKRSDGSMQPLEVFINSKDMESYEWVVALTRVLSAIFRIGLNDYQFIANELKAVFSPAGGFYAGKGSGLPTGQRFPSLVAAIGKVLETHLQKCGLVEDGLIEEFGVENVNPEDSEDRLSVGAAHVNLAQCPDCHEFTILVDGGCSRCTNPGCSYEGGCG